MTRSTVDRCSTDRLDVMDATAIVMCRDNSICRCACST